jgi:ribose transport system substrate-binding protein
MAHVNASVEDRVKHCLPRAVGADVMNDRCYAINVAYRAQAFFDEVTGTGRKISSVVPGVEFVLGGPEDADSNRQIEEIEALIVRRVKGIILFPADPQALVPSIDKATAMGIPVVTLFSDVVGSRRLTLVGGPERESGRRMAERILNAHPEFANGETKVLVSYNKPGETVTDERLEGMKEIFQSEKYKGKINVVKIVSDEGKVTTGATKIAEVLNSHRDVRVIFGLNARSAIGALSALREKRKADGTQFGAGDVVITGWDNEDDVMDNIEKGWIQATSVLHTALCTQIGFGILEAHNLGYLYPDSLQMRELSFPAVPNEILIPETFVDRENVAGYRRKK